MVATVTVVFVHNVVTGEISDNDKMFCNYIQFNKIGIMGIR